MDDCQRPSTQGRSGGSDFGARVNGSGRPGLLSTDPFAEDSPCESRG